MKFIRSFLSFNESGSFDVNLTDTPDIKADKEMLTNIQKNIADFKSKKNQIDQIFSKKISNDILKNEIDKIIGVDVSKRNPFIVNYLQVAQDQRRIDDLISKMSEDKISIEETKTLLSSSSDDNQRENLQSTISDVQKRINDANKSILILKKSIIDNKKKIDDDMKKKFSDMQNKISGIKDTRK